MRGLPTRRLNVYRAPILQSLSPSQLEFWPDGALAMDDNGMILACGPWQTIVPQVQGGDMSLTVFPKGSLILPGLIDLHTHLPQLPVAGRPRAGLLDWLESVVYPAESRFCEERYARQTIHWFFRELLSHGITTAGVLLTTHSQAARVAFETADQMGNRVVMGLTLMDGHGPGSLIRPADALLRDADSLCRTWHGHEKNRIRYAFCPRYALACSPDLLRGTARLLEQHPGAFCHTHLAEQRDEVAAVRDAFPDAASYTDVYHQAGLLGDHTLLAHAIHLNEAEFDAIQAAHARVIHCPSANLFLKSGRFRWGEARGRDIRVGLGSDVGAGPSLNMLGVMRDALTIQSDPHGGAAPDAPTVEELFYAATLGAADALGSSDRLGSLKPGKEADFIVLNLSARSSLPGDLLQQPAHDLLASLIWLGDERLVSKTFVRGQEVYPQNEGLIFGI
ncbi:MAG: guanine deaminase [Vampirovibrionales bacterium]|nr:guanine deaminase [Vampirovibrionales bacterium]